jgi:ABC-type polysaccharide/polyol phosphate export permease
MALVTTAADVSAGKRTLADYARLGWRDLEGGLRHWRLCYLMATGDMRRRFARSKLGQVWIMLSSAIQVSAIGAVWSYLWHQPIEQMLPYIAISMMSWQFISSVINDSTSAFSTSSNYFLNQHTFTSTIIYASIYRNSITFLLNMVFPLLICVAFGVTFSLRSLLSIAGLVIVVVALSWISYAVAILCARFRDIAQIVASVLQIVFFVTPVMWKPSLLPPEAQAVVDFNPFAAMLSIIRDPLLGAPVSLHLWAASSVLAFAGLFIALPFFGRFHRRVVYWL